MSKELTKICKHCHKEKSINEFSNKGKGFRSAKCKVCESLLRKNIDYLLTDFTLQEDTILTDFIINNRGEFINELISILNKDLKTICIRINELKFHSKLNIKTNCEYCGKEMIITPYRIINFGSICCSKKCNSSLKKGINFHKIISEGNCLYCEQKFNIYDNVPNQKFCTASCKSKYYCKNDLNKAETNCSNCDKTILKSKGQIKNYNHNFCSLECELEYKYNQTHEIRICEICNKEFECLKNCSQKMCSIQCQGVWQSINLIGENANNYNHNYSIEDRTYRCECCGKEDITNIYAIQNGRRFCSDICRQKWFAETWSQTDEWKEKSSIRAVKILEEGLISKSNTGCQTAVNNLLNSIDIKYINEKGFKYFAVDNYLSDYNLIIEVMGTYWHCDHRKYKTILYEHQVDRIKRDKAKHTYIKNNYDINILYLWENDILNNPNLCLNLINLYIDKKGVLYNYHSFNYIYNNNLLVINKNIDIPYMNWDIKELNKIINISIKEKMSKKQLDKWIAFNCEWCGKEKEQLISHYNKSNTHCCSCKCACELKKSKNSI